MVPGVKRAWSNESKEEGDTDCGFSALVSVGDSAGPRERSLPHEPQKRLFSGTSDAQLGQRIDLRMPEKRPGSSGIAEFCADLRVCE
jgi:hypothetical protein